jgi:hypothetical protein
MIRRIWLMRQRLLFQWFAAPLCLVALVACSRVQSRAAAVSGDRHTVVFEVNGGTPVAEQSVRDGKFIVVPPPTSKPGCDEFLGWYETEELAGSPATFPYQVNRDTTRL